MLQFAINHLIRWPKQQHDEVIQPVNKDGNNWHGKHAIVPEDAFIVSFMSHIIIVPLRHGDDKEVAKHSGHGDEHGQIMRRRPLMMKEGHFCL